MATNEPFDVIPVPDAQQTLDADVEEFFLASVEPWFAASLVGAREEPI